MVVDAHKDDLGLGAHAHGDGRGIAERLVDHAVALGELEQGGALFGGDGAFEIEEQADVLEAHGGFAVHAQGAAEIEIAFGADRCSGEGNFKGGGDGIERDAGAGDEGLQQHVAGAGVKARAAGGGMEARFDHGLGGGNRTGDTFADGAFGLQGDHRILRRFPVTRLERGLE